MNPLDIIAKYYPVGSEAYRILVIHSRSVAPFFMPLNLSEH